MGMHVVVDDLWLCQDCTIAAVSGDVSGIEDDSTIAKIDAGLESLGPHLVCGEAEEEFSRRECDCCGAHLAGYRHEFAILGEES